MGGLPSIRTDMTKPAATLPTFQRFEGNFPAKPNDYATPASASRLYNDHPLLRNYPPGSTTMTDTCARQCMRQSAHLEPTARAKKTKATNNGVSSTSMAVTISSRPTDGKGFDGSRFIKPAVWTSTSTPTYAAGDGTHSWQQAFAEGFNGAFQGFVSNVGRPFRTNARYPQRKAQPPHGLMKLPIELREEIWTYAMWDLPTRFIIDKDIAISKLLFYPRVLPSFTFINRALKQEIILTWVRRTRFIFHDSSTTLHDKLIHFVEQFVNGLPSVRMIGYHTDYWCMAHFSRDEDYQVIAYSGRLEIPSTHFLPTYLISRCPGIRSIIINDANSLPFYASPYTPERFVPLDKEVLARCWCFDGLFDMPKLLHFKLTFNDAKYVSADDTNWRDDLKEVLDEGFKEKGRTVDVHFEIKR
jgi:hypothetical protein